MVRVKQHGEVAKQYSRVAVIVALNGQRVVGDTAPSAERQEYVGPSLRFAGS